MRRFIHVKVVLALLTLSIVGSSATRAEAQGLTGQIGGSVVDSSNAALPGATVTVRNTATAVTRETTTDDQGLFVFTNLFAGSYDLRVTLSGFTSYEERGIVLSATARVAVPPIVMNVGGIEQTVTVEAAALRAQTQDGARSNTIQADEIESTQLRGRDFLGLLQGMPGVIDTSVRNAPGWNSFLGTQINGLSDQFMNLQYDGVVSKDTGFGAANYAAPSLDSIAEVKVQTSNYQAEFGRAGGANIVVVTKSGSSRFSGSGAYYKRHEAFNANTWSRRRACDSAAVQGLDSPQCEKERYRYDNSAFTLGGPVLIPGSDFNRDRDKLFFFYSLDMLPRTDPYSVNSMWPSAAERNGDFSRTFNNSGVLRYIRDPHARDPVSGAQLPCNVNTGGAGCFPGNIIPQERIHPVGRQMLNLLPLPDPALEADRVLTGGNYNYTLSDTKELFRRDHVLRADWNIRPGTTFYSRFQIGKERNNNGHDGTLMSIAAFPLTRSNYDINTMGIVNTLIHTFTPSTVLEVIVGTNWSEQEVFPVTQADADAMDYALQLPSHVPLFPNVNPMRVLPSMSWAGDNALGGGTNTRGISMDNRYPFYATNDTHNFSANLTHLRGAHNVKMGLYVERTARPARQGSNFSGTYNFNAASANPLNTNLGWANALLGYLNQYQEAEQAFYNELRFNQPEFFIQDNWRVNRRFTIDAGVRFSHIGPTYVKGATVGYFDPAAWDPNQAPRLWEPYCQNGVNPCSGTARVARNPITGELRANSWIGAIVDGSGNVANGTVFVDGAPPQYKAPGVLGLMPAARLGFGWDVTGDGKTAVRGGFGTTHQRYGDDQIASFRNTAPQQRTVSLNWTTIDDRANTPSLDTPQGATAIGGNYKPMTVHSWSLGVQRELPFRLLADVAYVGNRLGYGTGVNSSQSRSVPINDVNPLTLVNPTPDMIDVTTGNTLPTNFLRPYFGRAGISERQWVSDTYRRYDAIQIEIKRRLSNGFAAGVAYTGSRTKQFTGWDWFRTEEDNRNRHEHYAGSRPHNLTITYNWLIPGASRFLGNNVVAQAVLDGWQVSGLTTARGGTREGFDFAWSGAPANNAELTGGLEGSRPILVCDPNLPRGERTFDRQYRTECVRPPGPLTDPNDTLYQGTGFGAGTVDRRLSLGYVNHDLTLFKNFAMGNRRNLQVRVEMYNAFNTTQYSGVDTGAQFDFATGEQIDSNFGRVTGVRGNSNRVMQLGVRFTF